MLRDDSILVRRAPLRPLDQLLPKLERNMDAAPPGNGAAGKFVLMVSGSPGDAQRYRCTNKVEEFAFLGLTADSVESNQVDYDRALRGYEMFLLHRVQISPVVERFI